MLVVGFPAQAFDTNCYVVAPAAGEECLVVDPGIGIEAQLDEVLAEHRLRPVAVLLTHGHLDHVFSVTPVCGAKGVPAYIHSDDRCAARGPDGDASGRRCARCSAGAWSGPSPTTCSSSPTACASSWPAWTSGVVHAPGHTEGSVMFVGDG